MNINNKKLLGQIIKRIRKSNGLTQEKLAEAVGIETGSLSAIESGRHFPSLITLEKIASKLNVRLQAFFDFNDSMSDLEMKDAIRENLDKMRSQDVICVYKLTEHYKNS